MAAAQNIVGDFTTHEVEGPDGEKTMQQGILGDEGSLAHMLAHGLVGCAFAEASDGTCASGFAVGASQSAFAGSEWTAGMDKEEQQQTAGVIGAVVGYLTSGSEAANVSGGQQIAISGIANNRQLHMAEAEAIRNNAAKFAEQMGITKDEAIALLTAEALRRVDDTFRSHPENLAASQFLDTLNSGEIITGTDQKFFIAEGAQYENSALNSQYMLVNEDIYRLSSTAFAQTPGNLIYGAFNVGLAGAYDDRHLSPNDISLLQGNVASSSQDKLTTLFENHAYNDGFGDANFGAQVASFHLLMGGAEQTSGGFSAALTGTAQGVQKLAQDQAALLAVVDELRLKQSQGLPLSADEQMLLFEMDFAGALIISGGGVGGNKRPLRGGVILS